jgi:hypothetical protein
MLVPKIKRQLALKCGCGHYGNRRLSSNIHFETAVNTNRSLRRIALRAVCRCKPVRYDDGASMPRCRRGGWNAFGGSYRRELALHLSFSRREFSAERWVSGRLAFIFSSSTCISHTATVASRSCLKTRKIMFCTALFQAIASSVAPPLSHDHLGL